MVLTRNPADHHPGVVSLDRHRQRKQAPVLRLSPEYDGMEMLYANDRHPDKLFPLGIPAWALRADDSVVALVPWLDRLTTAGELVDPLNGRWEGFRFAGDDRLFTEVPGYKVQELRAARDYFNNGTARPSAQEIPDTIGTHVLFSADGFRSIHLQEVVSWRLNARGWVNAMIVDENRVTRTPVLPGDVSLIPATEHPHFRYFFQHAMANRIKERDPEALATIALLCEPHQRR
jgi:hypothetical protein